MSTTRTTDRVEISIAIPTYGREQILLDTLHYLLQLSDPAEEILVVDQTARHEAATESELQTLNRAGAIKWIRQERPSIPVAMNRGLREATKPVVLFLDDDIVPDSDLVSAHRISHAEYQSHLVAGRVIQPWQSEDPDELLPGGPFSFNSGDPAWIEEFMGGNFSVNRERAISLGGFDENFVRVAYRFEAEFAHRWRHSGERIFYAPGACIHHLKAGAGGTRTFGEHLTTMKPDHSVGAYYFFLRTRSLPKAIRASAERLFLAVMTRHHLRRPWWIPVTLISELAGLIWAFVLKAEGPVYVSKS